jgi:MFS family permease
LYGVLLGAVGAGAIAGALVLPRLRQRFDTDALLLGASLVAAVVMGILAVRPPQWAAAAILLLLGAGWITALVTLNGTAQAILPNWVRGRGLAIYLTVFNGAMAAGSILWGTVAELIGLSLTLLVGAGGLALVAVVGQRFKLPAGAADLAPSNHWPEPLLAEPVEHDRGPVLVTVEYRVRKEDRAAFLASLHPISAERRRDGAYAWGLAEDSADPERILEWFMVESWAEHMRQHRRVSRADAEIQVQVRRFHVGDAPNVQHFLAIQPGARGVADQTAPSILRDGVP